jgi:hypothetical protein
MINSVTIDFKAQGFNKNAFKIYETIKKKVVITFSFTSHG